MDNEKRKLAESQITHDSHGEEQITGRKKLTEMVTIESTREDIRKAQEEAKDT